MSKSNVKTNNVSGFRVAVMIISILVLSLIMAFSIILGISSLKKNGPLTIDNDATTVRKVVPNDGTLPTDAAAIDNIGYMAYVMDHQEIYHSYAYNSTKSTGYEQVTQSWKDYKSADMSGEGRSIMVSSDLSYSSLIKSSTQSCFLGGDKAIIRSGSKPSSTRTTPLEIEWASGTPDIYDKEGYKYVYGEFSTEISVYVINEDTLAGADPVVVNEDGTYSQKYYLNEKAGVWYQYGMKTRGGLKNYPEFKRIEITFTFDGNWRIFESYCEEKATISPRALGGMGMASDSKTTTVFDYSEAGFDGAHYGYFSSFFKQYQDADPGVNAPKGETGVLDVLGGGFSKVVSESGQQFKLALTLGETEYDGRIYLKLADLSDPLGSIDARVELEKKGSGKQDFYAEFRNGKINVYYSTAFAMTADIDGMSAAVTNIMGWVNKMTSQSKQPAKYSLTAEESAGGLDLGSLLNALKLEIKETEAVISLKSDNLLGIGLGIDASITFDRIVEEDGDLFSIKGVDLNYIGYNGEQVALKVAIVPDESGAEIISRKEQAAANLADYVNSIYKILNSKTVKVNIGLDDRLIEGLTLDATAYLSIGSDIAANVSVSALYNGISLKLDATYIYDGSEYGKIYLHVTEIGGTAVDAKVYCDIGDTVSAVESIIAIFNGNGADDSVKAEAAEAEESLVAIINKVLNLNFSKIIGNLESGNGTVSLDINVDELLKGLDVSLGFGFGKLALTLDSANDRISGNLEDLGLTISIEGSNDALPLISNPGEYLDLTLVLQLTEEIINEGKKIAEAEDIVFSADVEVGTAATVHAEGEVVWAGDSVKVGVAFEVSVENEQKLVINVVYDDTVKSNEPLVIITLNELGTTISVDEIDRLVETFTGFIEMFKDGGSATTYSAATPVVPYGGSGVVVGGKTLEEILSNEGVQAAIKAILEFANEFAIEMKAADAENAVYNLIVSHSGGLKVTLGANGGLSLGLAKAGEFNLTASVEAGNGTTVSAMRAQLLDNADGEIEFLELSDFVERIYKGFFAGIEDISIKDILGDDPYLVTIGLSGKNSGIDALEGVEITAELYYDEGVVGTTRATKLVYAGLNLDINGTLVKATAAYRGHTFYLELNNIGATEFTGIKFKADADNVYDVVEQLVRLITDTNIVETVLGLMGNGASAASEAEGIAAFAAMSAKNGTPAPSILTTLLDSILSLDFEECFKYDKATHTAEINVDVLAEALLGVKIGTVKALLDSENKIISASVQHSGSDAWITLRAEAYTGDSKKYEITPDSYTDINFIKTLISDLEKTAVDEDKNIYTTFTFTGTISADLVSLISVNFDNTKLTLNLDSPENFYVSLTADVSGKLFSSSWLGGAVIDSSTIGFTYADGLIVLGRDVNDSSKAQYKVMTIEYLLDNLLSGDNLLEWYLGIQPWIWSAASSGFAGMDVSSGLTTPKEYTLYEELTQIEEEGIFRLTDYLSGMLVNAGGYTSKFGNNANLATSKLNLSGDYYAFDINAVELTGGVLTDLCAAIMRDSVNGGISGLKAYGAIGSYVKFTLNLNEFKGSDASIAAPNYLSGIEFNRNYFAGAESTNHKTPIFGCYDTKPEANKSPYSSSDVLDTVYLEVYSSYESMLAGAKPERTLKVVYGSTVYLVRENFPEIVNGKKLTYVGEAEEALEASIVINDDNFDLSDYKVKICKKLSSDTMVEVELNFINMTDKDNPIIEAHSFALSPDAEIAEYKLNNYDFLGWFSDENFENQVVYVSEVTPDNNKITLYGKYIKSEFKQENGVNYTFDYEYWKKTGEFIYYVSGTNANISDYYAGGKYAAGWLEIEDEINGYPVTYIGANAFANTMYTSDDFTIGSLVNVLVPQSVIAVYENAFLNNKSIEKVVFLADNVFFGGKNTDKNTVFYGCHQGKKGNPDDPGEDYYGFKLYYNGIMNNNPYTHVYSATTINDKWYVVFYALVVVAPFNYKMDMVSSGWMFIKFSSADSQNNFGFTDGVYGVGEITEEMIVEAAIPELNKKSCLDGYIYGHRIRLVDSLIKGLHKYEIIAIDDSFNGWHLISFDQSLYDIMDDEGLEDGIVKYEGLYFVRPDTEVVFSPKDGLKVFTQITVSDYYSDGNSQTTALDNLAQTTVTMGNAAISVEFELGNAPTIHEVQLISAINFSLIENGTEFALENTYYIPDGTLSNQIALASIRAYSENSGYTFIGWAYENGTSLKFEDTITHSVYYAIWAKNRAELSNFSFEKDGDSLKLTVDSTNTIYGWYSNPDFDGTALGICSSVQDGQYSATLSLTTDSTVIYARMVYKFTYGMSAGSLYTPSVYDEENNTHDTNGSFDFLEGLRYSWAENKKILKLAFYSEDGTYSTRYFKISGKLTGSASNLTITGSFTNSNVGTAETVAASGDISITIKG